MNTKVLGLLGLFLDLRGFLRVGDDWKKRG